MFSSITNQPENCVINLRRSTQIAKKNKIFQQALLLCDRVTSEQVISYVV